MALQNDPRLFTGGYERFDTRPHVALYNQLKAREQARNDAFDEYMRNVNLKINPAGMRYQDMPAFEYGLKKMQDFGMQNREAIQNPRKDSGMASMRFQQMYQQQMNRIAGSKMAAEGLKPFLDVQADPKKARLLNKDRAMAAVQAHDEPQEIQNEYGEFVPNPNFKPFNAAELEFREDAFDVPQYLKGIDIKPSEKNEETISTDPKTLMRKVRITAKFKPEDYDRMATIGVQSYFANPKMKQLVDDMYNDPNNPEVLKLNKVFNDKFGKDIHSEGDLAAAMTIAGKETSESEVKEVDDRAAQARSLENMRQAGRKQLLAMRHALKEGDDDANDLWIDEYVDRISTEAKKPANRIEYKYRDGSKVVGYKIDLDPVLRKATGLDAKNNGQLIVTDDGEFIIAPFKTDANYNPLKGADNKYTINSDAASKITQDQLKLSLGKTSAGVKQTNAEMNKPSQGGKKRVYKGVDKHGNAIFVVE